MVTLEEAQKRVKKMLSDKRYKHVVNVAEAARSLALHYGVDPEKAQLAAWLHDIVKEEPKDVLLQIMEQDAIMAGSTASRPVPVWHGPCAAIYARHTLGVEDEGVLDAIACHTTGREDMTVLDKIIFLADASSAERSYPGVQRIRALARTDIDAAVVAAMEQNVEYLNRAGKELDVETLCALQSMKRRT